MLKWLVQLTGERPDLDEIAAAFPTGDIFVVRHTDDNYLTGPGLSSRTSPAEARQLASAALNNMCAVIALMSSHFSSLAVGHVVREMADGSRTRHYFMQADPGNIRIRGSAVTFSTAPARSAIDTEAQQLLNAATRRPRLLEGAAIFREHSDSWSHLSRILEEIELQFGQRIDKLQLSSASERARFTRSANSAEVSGSGARHAAGQFLPPSNPMALPEATRFIRRVLVAAMRLP